MSAPHPAPGSSPYRPHRCALPEIGHRGTVYECWCGQRWVAVAGLTIRDTRIVSMRPDWRPARPTPRSEVAPAVTARPTPYPRRRPR